MKIFLDWQVIQSEEVYFSIILESLNAPDSHLHNLDALTESLVVGGINGIEPPFCIINQNVDKMHTGMKGFYTKLGEIYQQAKDNDRKVRVFED